MLDTTCTVAQTLANVAYSGRLSSDAPLSGGECSVLPPNVSNAGCRRSIERSVQAGYSRLPVQAAKMTQIAWLWTDASHFFGFCKHIGKLGQDMHSVLSNREDLSLITKFDLKDRYQ